MPSAITTSPRPAQLINHYLPSTLTSSGVCWSSPLSLSLDTSTSSVASCPKTNTAAF